MFHSNVVNQIVPLKCRAEAILLKVSGVSNSVINTSLSSKKLQVDCVLEKLCCSHVP